MGIETRKPGIRRMKNPSILEGCIFKMKISANICDVLYDEPAFLKIHLIFPNPCSVNFILVNLPV